MYGKLEQFQQDFFVKITNPLNPPSQGDLKVSFLQTSRPHYIRPPSLLGGTINGGPLYSGQGSLSG